MTEQDSHDGYDHNDRTLQTMVTVFLDTEVSTNVQMCPEPESVAFRFGEHAHRRLDLHVGYDQLDRLSELVDDAKRFRDSVTEEQADAAPATIDDETDPQP